MMTERDTILRWQALAEKIQPGSTLVSHRSLSGGVSAQTSAIEIAHPDGTVERLVARMHGEIDRAANPHIARDEFHLLSLLKQHGLAVPAPRFLDDSCEIFPLPVLVIEMVDGQPDLDPDDARDHAIQAARELARIHTIPDSPELSFLPHPGINIPPAPEKLDISMHEDRIREPLEAHRPERQINSSTLLHGDYWPGNFLWKDDRLVAVVDWEDARVGDPLSDLANARLEQYFNHGRKAMEAFTEHYLSLNDLDLSHLAWWELRCALNFCGKISGWGLDEDEESRIRRRHSRLVERVLERLPG